MAPVARIGRVLDVTGLLILLTGCGFVIRAWIGFREVQGFVPTPGGPAMAAVQLADRFWRLERIGVALILVGIAVFVAAWWTGRRPTSPE